MSRNEGAALDSTAFSLCPDYHYLCRDHSLLTPPFRRFLVRPIMPLIPRRVPANVITIFSNLVVYFAFFLALTEGPGTRSNFTLIAILVLLYAVGDHADGMQAQRTRTSSPLGEFIDHFLDAFNNGVLIAIVLLLFRIPNSPAVVFLFLSFYLAHAAVYYEEYRTKWLVFEWISSLEATLLVVVLLLVGRSVHFRVGLKWPAGWGLTVAETGFVVAGLFALLTFLRVWQRVGTLSLRFGSFCSCTILLALASCFFFDRITALVLLVLYCVEYIGRLMYAHLVDRVEKFPDFVVPLVITVGLGMSVYFEEAAALSFFAMVIYTVLLIIMLVCRTFSRLRQCWVWWNPP